MQDQSHDLIEHILSLIGAVVSVTYQESRVTAHRVIVGVSFRYHRNRVSIAPNNTGLVLVLVRSQPETWPGGSSMGRGRLNEANEVLLSNKCFESA